MNVINNYKILRSIFLDLDRILSVTFVDLFWLGTEDRTRFALTRIVVL